MYYQFLGCYLVQLLHNCSIIFKSYGRIHFPFDKRLRVEKVYTGVYEITCIFHENGFNRTLVSLDHSGPGAALCANLAHIITNLAQSGIQLLGPLPKTA